MHEHLKVTATDGIRFEDGADRGRIIVSGRDTGSRYSLMEYVVAAGDKLAPHAPRAYGPHLHREIEETFLVQSGTLEFLLGHEVTTLVAGDFVRVPPGVRHGYMNTSGAEVRLLVGFVPGGFEALFLGAAEDFIADATRLYASEFAAS